MLVRDREHELDDFWTAAPKGDLKLALSDPKSAFFGQKSALFGPKSAL